MMKIDKMPTIMALLVFSWLIALFGLATGIYLIVLRPGEMKSLLIAFSILLGSLILAAVIRTFGNIGQMIFDLKSFVFVFYHSVSNDSRALIQSLTNLNQDLKTQLQTQTTTLTQGLQELDHSLSPELQTLNQSLTTLSQDTQEVRETLNQSLLNLNQDLKTQLQTQTISLSNDFQNLKNALEQINCDSKDINQNIYNIKTFFEEANSVIQDLKTQVQAQANTLTQDLQKLNQSFSNDLQSLRNSFEQVNVYSKDISQNIHQIRAFFEQIEKHLDLKK